MISKEDAWAVLDAAAAQLKTLTYEELGKLAAGLLGSPDTEWREFQQVTLGGEHLHIDVLMGGWGLLRRRISVEMVLSSDDGTLTPATVPCVYFERFRSGRLYVPRTKGWEIALFKSLPYAFFGGVVIAGLALVWHFFFGHDE